MAHPNEDLLRQGLEAFSKGDMEGVAALFADDVVWHTPGRGPLAGDHRGKDQVMSMLGKQAELTGGTFRAEAHDILANDEHGCCLPRSGPSEGGRRGRTTGSSSFISTTGRHLRSGCTRATSTRATSSSHSQRF